MRSRRAATAILIFTLLLVSRASDAATLGLAWDPPTDGVTTGYVVRYGTSPGIYSQSIDVGMVTSHSITTLTDGTTYYFAVQAYNASGQFGPLSAEVSGIAGGGTGVPAAPTSLVGVVRDGQYLDLSWQPPSGTVTGYRVEVGTGPGQSNVTVANIGTSTFYTVYGLMPGTYYTRVRAVNGAGTSAPSNEVVVTLGSTTQPTAPPGAPTNLTATIRKRKFVDLAWEAPSTGAAAYTIEVGNAPGLTNIATTTTTATRFTANDLPVGTYYVRVRATNSAGSSPPSNEVRVDIVRGGKPSPPSSLTASLRDGNLIDVSWQEADEDALYYRVEVGTTSGRTDVSSFTTGVTSSFTIGQLPSRRYYIRVRSANDHGFSDPSNEVVVAGVGGSDAPQRFSATVTAGGGLRLFWDAPQDATGVTGYLIEAGTGPGRADIGSIPISTRSFASGPVPNGTYFLRVRSLTAAGPGSASNEVVAHVGVLQQCTAPPAAPRLVATTVGSILELSWSPGVGDAPTGYVLDVGSTPGGRDIASAPLSADVTTLATPVPDGTYALRLIAVNSCGASAWGTDTTVTVGGPQLPLPGAPGWLEHQVNGRSVTLTWSPPFTGGQATSYVIEVLGAGDEVILSLGTGNPSTTFTHGDVPPGQYTVRVRAMNARGAGAPTNRVVVSVQ